MFAAHLQVSFFLIVFPNEMVCSFLDIMIFFVNVWVCVLCVLAVFERDENRSNTKSKSLDLASTVFIL